MKVIIFIAILGLALAGLRGDKKKVPHSIHHLMPHHHATHYASKTSGHGHGHGSSNSENSEELFNLLGALEGDIQGTIDTITGDIKGTIDTLTAPSKSTSTKSKIGLKKIPHSMPHSKAGKSGKSGKSSGHGHDSSNSENSEELFNIGTAILQPIINTTGLEIAYPTQQLNTTQGVQDFNPGLAVTGYIMPIQGLTIAGAPGAFAFVDLQGIIENDIQGTIDTIQGDITGTVDTIQGDLQGTANTVTQAVESITPAEAAATGNAIASTIGTGLTLGNDALKDVNDGLSIANSVIP